MRSVCRQSVLCHAGGVVSPGHEKAAPGGGFDKVTASVEVGSALLISLEHAGHATTVVVDGHAPEGLEFLAFVVPSGRGHGVQALSRKLRMSRLLHDGSL